MTDNLGRIWLIFLLVFIVGLSIWLWIGGRKVSPQAEEAYIIFEASKVLGCRPYILSKGIPMDLNEDGAQEYLISCDSSLSAAHHNFAIFQAHQKKIETLIHFREGKWLAGKGPSVEAGQWVIDRAERRLLFVDAAGNYFRLIWKSGHIELIAE